MVPGRLTTRKTTFRSAANKITCVTHIPTIFPAVSTDDPDSRADRKHQRAALSKKKKYRRVCVHPWGREKTRGGRRKRKEGVDSARDSVWKERKKSIFLQIWNRGTGLKNGLSIYEMTINHKDESRPSNRDTNLSVEKNNRIQRGFNATNLLLPK